MSVKSEGVSIGGERMVGLGFRIGEGDMMIGRRSMVITARVEEGAAVVVERESAFQEEGEQNLRVRVRVKMFQAGKTFHLCRAVKDPLNLSHRLRGRSKVGLTRSKTYRVQAKLESIWRYILGAYH